MRNYKDRVVIELAGHDHWEDIRVYADKDGNKFRNMFVATGIGMDHKQLPGFNTMKIDGDTNKPKELKETILDITKVYGQNTAPPLEDIPVHTVDFTYDYGISDLSAESIYDQMQTFEKNDFNNLLNYISDKLGYDHKDPK